MDGVQWGTQGDGGPVSTIDDLARWDRNFTTGTVGGPAFLGRRSSLAGWPTARC